MSIRQAAVAGRFYDDNEDACEDSIAQMLKDRPVQDTGSGNILGAMVPHAGWAFSGDIAMQAIATAKKSMDEIDTYLIFGAIHVCRSDVALIYDSGQWQTPLGLIDIDADFAKAFLEATEGMMISHLDMHEREHSIEVEVPLIQYLHQEKHVKIVPVMIPPMVNSGLVGRKAAEVILKYQGKKNVMILASTDLTHYGPSYHFTTMGTGDKANAWAKETNDMIFINLVKQLAGDSVVASANNYNNACGAGAVAATIAAVKALGGTKGELLTHTTSAEIMAQKYSQKSEDSVGYAGMVFY